MRTEMIDSLALSLLIGLAVFRLVRLWIKDTIFDRPRARMLRWRIPTKLLAGMLCPWCISAYFAGAIVGFVWWLQPVALPGLVWLASWTVASVIYRFTDGD